MKILILRSQIKICKYHLNRVVDVVLKVVNDNINVKIHIKINCKFVKTMIMMLMKM